MARHYWLDLFTGTTWKEFLAAGASVSGFREARRSMVQKIAVGDYLLCYLTGVSRWIGIIEVVSGAFEDVTPIWSQASFSVRLRVKLLVQLTPETAVPVHTLRDSLSVFQNLKNPNAWTGHFRGSPSEFSRQDGEAIVAAIKEAEANPIVRPVDKRKLARRPRRLQTSTGPVTVPPKDDHSGDVIAEPSLHDTIQWQLLRMGNDMGLGVWVATSDRRKVVDGQAFTDLKRLRSRLPNQFDEAMNRTVRNIDVLWLDGNAIVAAFEIESTTSVYSGLLRMADLLAMQPNLSIPLYIVAPDSRRNKVFYEVNRPTFARMSPPLAEVVRYIASSTLTEKYEAVRALLSHVKPSLLDEISESCIEEQD